MVIYFVRKEIFMKYTAHLFALGHLAVDSAQGAIPALIPYFMTHYGLSYKDAGALVFANLLIASVLQPILGFYADKVSKPWLAPLGCLMGGVAITSLGFTSSYWTVILAVVASGMGSAIFHPEAALMVNKLTRKKKGKAMGTFSVGGNAGFAVGPMVAGACAYKFGIEYLTIFGLFSLIVALGIFTQMPRLLREAKSMDDEGKASGQEEKKNDWHSFGKLSVLILVRSAGFTLCNTFLPLLWIHVLGTSKAEGAGALTILFTIGAFLTYFGGIFSDKFGFIKVIRISFFFMVPAFFILTHTDNVLLATILLLPAAISLFAPYSPIVVLGQQYLGKNAGFAAGVTLGLSTSIGGLFAPLIGWAADQWGLQMALQVLWVAGFIGFAVTFTLSETKGEA